MTEDFDDRPDLKFTRKHFVPRMNDYAKNADALYETFQRYGVRRVSGSPGEMLRRDAVNAVVDMQMMLGTDRLVISDRLAVVPNYYGTYKANDDPDEEFVWSKTEPVVRMVRQDIPSGTMVYVIGLELVIRDFRNFEAMYEPLAEGNLRYLRHPCNTPLPPVVPDLKARTFDIPIGYIRNVVFSTINRGLELSVVGQNLEHISIFLEIPKEPQMFVDGKPKVYSGNDAGPRFIDDITPLNDEN